MPNDHPVLENRHVLVVEDEYFLASDMSQALRDLGASVVGPAPTPERALELISSGATIDLAVLDIDLRGEAVFPLADALGGRGIPYVFATGYDQSAVPPAYWGVPRWEKPFDPYKLANAISRYGK